MLLRKRGEMEEVGLLDDIYMKQAILLGKNAKGKTGDNPYVGCIIVKDGKVLGEGCTSPPGGPHAEVMALMDAEQRGEPVIGATLYSTVEPCSFYGRTPACAKIIIERKIARVVVGIRDPHPRVNGAGIQMLQTAGIEVKENVCQEAVRVYLIDWLNTYEN